MKVQGNRAAVYCRLSREDGNEESQSIQSQKDILTKYVIEQGFSLVDIYSDDGYSGTNFERPAFQRMINDIELGLINIVVTKDLSRLGRNYILTGYYTEEYFPLHNVRYIALNDNYDTQKDDNDFAPFKNIINEWYAKDISKKVRFTLDNQAKNGVPRNTVFPVFGYKYNESYERIPDPETAPIVKMIFEEYIRTASTNRVSELLIKNKVKMPKYYNAIKYNYNKEKILALPEEELYNWQPRSVRDILVKQEYTGVYITAKSKSKSFKLKQRDRYNKDAYVFENRYEPLITNEQFDIAQRLLARGKSGQIPFEENIYKNILLCHHCGKPLRVHRWQNKRTKEMRYRYLCREKDCSHNAVIYKHILNEVVKNELIQLKELILSHEEEFKTFAESFDQKGRNLNLDNESEIEKHTARCKELDLLIQRLFEQNTLGKLPQSTYNSMMDKYTKERQILEEIIFKLSSIQSKESNSNNKDKAMELIELFKETEIEDLNPVLIHKFIKQISIEKIKDSKNMNIHIKYSKLDRILKEFNNNEKPSSDIC